MRRVTVLGLLALVVLLAAAAAQAVEVAKVDRERQIGLPDLLGYVPDRFIVVLDEGVPVDHLKDAGSPVALSALPGFAANAERFAVRRLQPQFPGADRAAKAAGPAAAALSRYYKVSIGQGSLEEAMAAYRELPGVARVEPIGIHTVTATPNDPRYDDPPPTFPYDQWHYFAGYGVDADLAWDTDTGSPDVLVGVLDTGVKYDHGDLGGSDPPGPDDAVTNGNIWVNPGEVPGNGIDDDGNGYVDDLIGWDFVDRTDWYVYQCVDNDCGGADNDPRDGNGHGTHVAGTIAAITNNGYSVAGIAGGWGDGTFTGPSPGGVKIVPCRIGYTLSYLGSEVGVVIMDYVAEGMYYLAELKRAGHDVAAVNCSFGSSNSGGLSGAADYLIAQDVMIIVSAGNDGSTSASYLGTRTDCMDVAATDAAGNPASFTNYGSWVDIAAPGVEILSTYTDPADPATDYIAIMDGTSMSCPHVVGCAALLEAHDPGLTAQQKWDLLVGTATPYNGTRDLGSGIVNIRNALDAAGGGCDLAADFAGDPLVGCAPLAVGFSDLSAGTGIDGWSWDFGDGGTSTAQNPGHTYAAAGTYTVSLTVSSSSQGCDDTATKTGYVTVQAATVADFSGTPTSGYAPLAVQFTDASTGNPDSWSWDFGDGGTATVQNPSHTYAAAGTYTVSLTAGNGCGSDTATRVDYITVTEAPPATRAYAVSDIPVAGTVGGTYVATHAGDNVYESITEVAYGGHPRKTYSYLEHRWNFSLPAGSGQTFHLEAHQTASSDGDNFAFEYSTDGAVWNAMVTVSATSDQVLTYELPPSLSGTVYVRVVDTARSWGGTTNDAVYVDEMYIETAGAGPQPPVANFAGTPTSGVAPLAVQFTDGSTGDPTGWSWDFGDGGTATVQNPGHTYTAAGVYTVSLTATNAYGSDTETKVGYITVVDAGATIHVADIAVTRKTAGPNASGIGTITIHDAGGQPVSGATVHASATGPVPAVFSGPTGADGTVTFETGKTKNATGEWCFEVTDVTHASYTYDPAANAVTQACESAYVYGEGGATLAMPGEFGVENAPNPFNPMTTIYFDLPSPARVKLEVYDIAGRRVAVLADREYGAGRKQVTWNAAAHPSGLYFYRITAGEHSAIGRMMLLK